MTNSNRKNDQLSVRQEKQILWNRKSWKSRSFLTVMLLFLLMTISMVSTFAAEKNIAFREFPIASIWNTGITQTGTNLPLRNFLSKAIPQGTSFFIDRRIDPALPVSFSFDNTPFLKGIESLLSDDLGLEIFVLDNVLYIGPKESTGTLIVLIRLNRQQLEKIDPVSAANLLKKSSLNIPYASISHDILHQFAQKGKFQWSHLKRFPFDCWNESKLSPLPLIDQISLILAGFDCRLEIDIDQKEYKFVRCQKTDILELSLPKNKIKDLDHQIPSDCRMKEEASHPNFVRISGSLKDLIQLESLAIQTQQERYLNSQKGSVARRTPADRKTRGSGKKKIISGEVKNIDLEHLFNHLQKNLNVTFRLEESLSSIGISTKTQISCSFNNSDAHEAAKIIAETLKVQFRWEGNNICFYH